MKTGKFWAIFTTAFLLASCAQMNPHHMDMTNAIRNANTSADHNRLARHYEGVANDMRRRAQEHEKELEEYESHPYYGKRAQDLKAHCRTLINNYERAAEANTSMARVHRQMAEEAQ
ncbi:hypothetical protein SAMN05216299_11720 [Nitrosospira sp. Nsp14]|jgi:hypothetical protein|uniref:hypothetical protein n=1 Tax=Nitrosospira sp. Nsp14 TaxID=1855333 RepID=UPI0008E9D2A8|nr:hypothetical protein [Nitrosospira sp. Nsp14]SFH50104.1 hypothetical protein SAMN05216299_11720 [Nitrosospira sp. Nsp14]